MATKEQLTGLPEEMEDARTLDVIQYGSEEMDDEVEKGYVPEGFESEEEFLKQLREGYESDMQADEDNRREGLDDKKFAVGEQWDPTVLEHRQGLPCLTINTIPQFTAQLVGDWRQSRNSIKVLPSESGDTEIASVRGDLIRSIEYKSRADRVYDAAFESQVTCGDGAFRVAVEYARDDVFDQDIFIRPIDDAFSVTWDRMSIDPTGRDARHCYVEDTIPKNEFKRKFKDASPDELAKTEIRSMRSAGWLDDDTVRVVEHWRMIERKRLLALFNDGSVHVLDADSMEELVEKYGNPVKTRIAPCLYAQMHLTTGWKILSGPYEYKLNRLPIIRMSGRVTNVGGKRVRYGLVRFIKDPARLRNFWRSVAAEQLGYTPKAQWMATESAVEGREESIRKAHLSRDPLLIFNDEAQFGSNVQRVEPPQMQMALLNEANINTQDMKDVTGIHDASLGIKSNETSGKAIMARQKEGDIASLTFYDNGNASLLEAGDVINQLIGQIYDGTRIVRLIGEDEAPKLVKINDPSDPESPNLAVGNYDVAMSTGASYTTRRAESAEAMMQAIQVWPNLIQVAGDIVAKAQDWPGADKLAERLKKTIPPQFLDPEDQAEGGMAMQSPEEMQQAMQRLQQLEMENQTLQQELKDKQEKLEIDRYNAETQRIRALSDHEVDGNQMEMNAIQNILDVSEQERQRELAEESRDASGGGAS
jgi:hypothetical protein